MKELSPEMSLSLRLGAGFALILLLMLALGAIGLGRLAEVNRREIRRAFRTFHDDKEL